jgi:hypothetical protein
LRQYIYQSTRLKNNENSDEKQGEYYKGMFNGIRRPLMGQGGLGVNITKDLPLSKEEYYELLEMLVIYIWLPQKGYERTTVDMIELPMPKDVREALE